jgi:hypothetical protein
MATNLGLRYPKAHEMGHVRSSTLGTNSQGPVAFTNTLLRFDGGDMSFFVNPARYSEVRKVVFWFNAVLLDPTPPATQRVRLRLGPTSSTNDPVDWQLVTINPGDVKRTRGSGSAFALPVGTEAELIAKAGDYVDLQDIAAFTDRSSSMFFLEFDRFDPSSAEFFNGWDLAAAAAGANDYAMLKPVLELESGLWSTDSKSSNLITYACGMSIVQAPTSVNRTTTIINANIGWVSYGAEATTFGTPRAWPFRYLVDDWDNVTSIHMWSFLPSSGGAGSWSMELQVAAMQQEGGAVTATSRYLEQFTDAYGSSNIDALHRSQDILPSIVDGDFLGMEWRKLNATAQGQPWGYFEIIQENFNKTVCPHVSSISGPQSVSELTEPEGYWYSKGYFDPSWYQSLPAANILSGRIWGGIKHASAGDDPTQKIVINADPQANPSTSLFNVVLGPEVSGTPVATLGYKLVDSAITGNSPINLAGDRTLVTRFNAAVWNSGQPGGMILVYALNVPNREFLDLGPLFELGAFDPEGCAATSAGLGDKPGILVITNGSTIPQKFNPTAAGTTAEIEDVGVPTPFSGEVPGTQANDAASSPEGGLDLGIYTYRYTFRNCCTGKESDPNPDDITVDTSGASPAASVTLSFADVRIPGDPQLCEICIYRTLVNGDYPIMAKVGCFNIDTTTVFVDDLSDDALDFLNEGLSILNAPMPCVPVVVDFRNRLFGLGDIPNLTPAGTVSVVNGSDIVLGDGSVEWDRCLKAKFIQIGADCRSYEILEVLPPEAGLSPPIARLKLVDAYEGTTDTGLTYTICGRPNRLYYSEPLEPECWPAANFLDIEPGDGDRLMGAVSNFDRLVICKRRKTYVLTFREIPALEVIVPSRISSDIGCIAPRSFAQVESGSVWLSDRGLALFDGRSVSHVEESANMNDLFVDPDNDHYIRRDRNGRVIDAVGVFYPKREQYLLLLPTIQTERGCNLMLVWDVKMRNVTLLKFCQEFQSMTVGKDADGNERVYLGDTNGFVWIFDIGDTDGVGYPNATGTVRGSVLAAGVSDEGADYLQATGGGFITGGLPGLASLSGVAGLSGAWGGDDLGLAGVCVYTRPADAALDDPWTVRTIYAATDDTLYVTPPWDSETPAVGDDFMVGAIDFDCVFKPQNYGVDDMTKRDWRQVVTHEIESFSSKLRVELLPDFTQVDPDELTVVDPTTNETGEGRIFRMDYEKGRQVKPVGRRVFSFMAVRFKNFAPEEPIKVINHSLMMTPRTSK